MSKPGSPVIGYGYAKHIAEIAEYPDFKKLTDLLTNLQNQYRHYTLPDESQGNIIPALDAEGKENYLQSIKAIEDEVSALRKLQLNTNERKALGSLKTSLEGDTYALLQYNPEMGYMNMAHIFENSRPITVDISGQNLGNVGANLSSRTPFTYTSPDGKKYDGFFTKGTIYDPADTYREFLSSFDNAPEIKNYVDCMMKYETDQIRASLNDWIQKEKELMPNGGTESERMKHFREFAKDTPLQRATIDLSRKIREGKPGEITDDELIATATQNMMQNYIDKSDYPYKLKLKAIEDYGNRMKDKYDTLLTQNTDDPYLEKYGQALQFAKDNEKTPKVFDKLRVSFCSMANKIGLHDTAAIDTGSRIDSRNSAMSSVASLLGKPSIIAKAVPMSIMKDGKVVEGTFMATAEGIDVNHRTMDNYAIRHGDANNSGVLSSMADLQIIDYICGNIDRHGGNLIYQFDKETRELTSVVGIDNDLSFGAFAPTKPEAGRLKMSALTDMLVMTASMANKVMSLTKEQLMQSLSGHQLTGKQKQAVWIRTDNLQKFIRESQKYFEANPLKKPEPGHIKIIPDKDFDKLTIADLQPRKDMSNIFQKAYTLDNPILEKKPQKKADVTKNHYIFDADAVKEYSKLGYSEAKKMDKATNIRGTSQEFEKLKKALEEFGNFHAQRKNKVMNEADIINHDQMVEHIRELADAYLVHHEQKKTKTDYAKDRARLVQSIKNTFMDKTIFDKLKKEDLELIHQYDQQSMERESSQFRAKSQMLVMKAYLDADAKNLTNLAKELTNNTTPEASEKFAEAVKEQILHTAIADKYCDKNMKIKLSDFGKVQNILNDKENMFAKIEGAENFQKLKQQFATPKGRSQYASKIAEQYKTNKKGEMEKSSKKNETVALKL